MNLDADLVAVFAECLDSPDVAERSDAVAAVGRLGVGPQAESLLARLADEDDAQSVRFAARRALEALSRRLTRAAYDEGPSPSWLATAETPRRFAALSSLTLDSLDRLAVLAAASADGDPWVQAAALKLLGSDENPSSLELLRGALADERAPGLVRSAALDGLGRRDPGAAAEVARGLLASSEGPLRRSAVRVLAAADVEDVLNRLDGMLRGLDRRARAAAVWSLALVDDPRVEDVAVHALAQESDRELMEQEAALLLSRESRRALGAAGVLRRSPDDRVAAVATTLHSQLMRIHGPSLEELAALEESFLEEERQRRLAQSSALSPTVPSSPGPEEAHGRSARSLLGLVVFLILAALMAVVAAGRVVVTAAPSAASLDLPTSPVPEAGPPSAALAVLGPGGTFGGRAVVDAVLAEHGELQLRGAEGLVLRLRLEGEVPSWVRPGSVVMVTATGGRAFGSVGVVYLDRGRVEPVP